MVSKRDRGASKWHSREATKRESRWTAAAKSAVDAAVDATVGAAAGPPLWGHSEGLFFTTIRTF